MSDDDLSHERTPLRHIPGRSGRRPVVSGIVWLSPDQVPGAVLSPEAQRRLNDYLDALREWQARSRVSGASYVIYR